MDVPRPIGRKPFSKRRRTIFAAVLAASLATTIVVAVVAALSSSTPPARVVPLPAADREASPELRRAAERVGFSPIVAPDLGTIERGPAFAARPPANGDLLPAGSRAPGFTLRTPTGEAVSLADLRGKAVLLEFFATWCPHCSAESPHLRALYRSLPSSRFAFVSIDASGGDAASVFAYHVFFGLPYPAVLDPDPDAEPATFPDRGKQGPVSKAYRAEYLPTFYVLDRRGRIAWRSDGEQPDALLRQQLARAARS